MSAEVLRQAAAVMTELAESQDKQTPVNTPVEAVWLNSRRYLVMTPDFVSAVAAWLESVHINLDTYNATRPESLHAFAVARAYLGDTT